MDRFVIVKNEEVMENQSLCLMENKQYFTGVYFLNMTGNETEFPSMVGYKIRHPPQLVDCKFISSKILSCNFDDIAKFKRHRCVLH